MLTGRLRLGGGIPFDTAPRTSGGDIYNRVQVRHEMVVDGETVALPRCPFR
jgi:hypothetical protein